MNLKFNFLFLLLFFNNSFAQIDTTTASKDTIIFADSTQIIPADSIQADSSLIGKMQAEKKDTLVPLYFKPFSSSSGFISNNNIIRYDYESPADVLKLFSVSFINDHGIYGYPDEFFIYGIHPSGTAILHDGILLNNRSRNGFDLNLLQSESIDSIEIIKLPRAFLYSFHYQPAAVNFIEKDFLSAAPYTRIKYYEGPYGQAMFDGIFNARVLNRLNLFIDVTNRKGDESFSNTDFSIWQANLKLKYFSSNKLNLTGSYRYDNSDAGLNGGIDVDSIYQSGNNFSSTLYDEIRAPVNSLTAREKSLRHMFKLQGIWKPDEIWRSDFNLYYLFDQNITNEISPDEENKFKNYSRGFNLRQTFSQTFFNLELLANYEQTDFKKVLPDTINFSQAGFSVSPAASFYLADSLIIPSAFMKFSGGDFFMEDGISGYGFDVKFNTGRFNIYAGYSSVKFFLNDFKNIIEAGASFSGNGLFADVKLFSIGQHQSNPSDLSQSISYGLTGAGFTIKYHFWKLLLENYNYYYYKNNLSSPFVSPHDYNFNMGIYFKDILFNNNLDLKTGFVLYAKKGAGLSSFRTQAIRDLYEETSYRIDFTLSGIIRKRAVVYFTWENLTNNNYYIVPFYPMPERNIRFGISWELFN